MNLRDLANRIGDSEDVLEALEAAYARGIEHRKLTPTEEEHEALLRIFECAQLIEARGPTDWEGQGLASAIDAYKVAACKTPTGKRAHASYVRGNGKGDTVCAFCRVVIHPAKRSSPEAKGTDNE